MELFAEVKQSLWTQLPVLALILASMAVLVADVLLPAARRWLLSLFSVGGVALSLAALHLVTGGVMEQTQSFFGSLRGNYLVFLAQNVILAAGLFICLISPRYIRDRAIPQGEYYAILLFVIMSMLVLAASTELLTLFLNVEMLSIGLYILAGIEKRNVRSTEAAFKYFLLGSFAAAFLLFGIAFVFGATGQTRYDMIAQAIAGENGLKLISPQFLAIGFALMFVGFAFKLTLAPFHMYAPDVYEGSPTPIAAAIASGTKVAGFVAFFHVIELAAGWSALPKGLWIALYGMVALSMIVGNVGAIVQPNLKRMLAYSSISHSGYTVLPMVVLLASPRLFEQARDAVAFYLLAYTVMTLLVFGVAASLGPLGETRIANYAGLGRRHPLLALVMAIGLLSLLGMPPTIGFFGKVMLFKVAVDGAHVGLAILGVLTSVMSAYYYLRVIVTMFMEEPAGEATALPPLDGANKVALTLCSLALFVYAIFPWIYLSAS